MSQIFHGCNFRAFCVNLLPQKICIKVLTVIISDMMNYVFRNVSTYFARIFSDQLLLCSVNWSLEEGRLDQLYPPPNFELKSLISTLFNDTGTPTQYIFFTIRSLKHFFCRITVILASNIKIFLNGITQLPQSWNYGLSPRCAQPWKACIPLQIKALIWMQIKHELWTNMVEMIFLSNVFTFNMFYLNSEGAPLYPAHIVQYLTDKFNWSSHF